MQRNSKLLEGTVAGGVEIVLRSGWRDGATPPERSGFKCKARREEETSAVGPRL